MGAVLELLIAALLAMIAAFVFTASYGWGLAALFAILAGVAAILLVAFAKVLMARGWNR